MSESDFAGSVIGLLDDIQPFKPRAVYIKEGDAIEFVAAPDDYYRERIDSLVTVYVSEKTGEVVGSFIKGISRFMDEARRESPGLAIEIDDGKVELRHLFRWQLWSVKGSEEIKIIRYKKLVDLAEQSNLSACLAGG